MKKNYFCKIFKDLINIQPMTYLLSSLHPVSQKHSIKEAVITVFLVSKIMKPKDYGELIQNDFKTIFQQFETISQTQIKVENQNLSVQQHDDAGFKFVRYDDQGKPSEVLRGLNEENRYFFSFHSFDYENWSSFKSFFLKYIDILIKFQPGLFAQAYSLLYLDEFEWDNREEYKSEVIFNKESEFLPRDFFNSDNVIYNINLEKEKNGVRYSDRLDIAITDKLLKKNILVSHNQTFMMSDMIRLDFLLTEDKFNTALDEAHKDNKKLLTDILVEEVCSLIKI